MESIINIKNIFNNVNILKVFADCMYMPTQERLVNCSKEYMAKESIHIYGFYDDAQITGVIAIEQLQDGAAEVKGIAVNSEYRKRGIGKRLIQYSCETLSITELIAETDDDAVEFYKSCGFITEKFLKNGKYIRYNCIFHKNSSRTL